MEAHFLIFFKVILKDNNCYKQNKHKRSMGVEEVIEKELIEKLEQTRESTLLRVGVKFTLPEGLTRSEDFKKLSQQELEANRKLTEPWATEIQYDLEKSRIELQVNQDTVQAYGLLSKRTIYELCEKPYVTEISLDRTKTF